MGYRGEIKGMREAKEILLNSSPLAGKHTVAEAIALAALNKEQP